MHFLDQTGLTTDHVIYCSYDDHACKKKKRERVQKTENYFKFGTKLARILIMTHSLHMLGLAASTTPTSRPIQVLYTRARPTMRYHKWTSLIRPLQRQICRA